MLAWLVSTEGTASLSGLIRGEGVGINVVVWGEMGGVEVGGGLGTVQAGRKISRRSSNER